MHRLNTELLNVRECRGQEKKIEWQRQKNRIGINTVLIYEIFKKNLAFKNCPKC